jgi:DNA-binding transcriptional LysR family regulator
VTRASLATSSMDLRHLVCFAALAEFKTAVAAAARVGCSPSHVSSQVRALEQKLAVGRLADRQTPGGLTDAGQALLDQAYPLFRLHLALLGAAKGLRRSRMGILNFGAEVDSSSVPERSRVVESFLAASSGARLELSEGSSWETLAALENGTVDVVMARVPRARAGGSGVYRVLQVRRSTPWLLVPSWHRLARGTTAPELADLAGERLASPPRDADPGFWDRCLAPFAAAGAELVPMPEWSADALIDRVSRSGELTVLPDWLVPSLRLPGAGIVTWSFGHAVCFDDLCFAARASADSALAERFLDTAAHLVGCRPKTPPDGGGRPGKAAPFRLESHAGELHRHALDTGLLRAFVAVAGTKSFTAAAAALYTSQPWLSTQVRSLEEQLGLSLFDRTSHHVAVTPDGAVLLRHAKAVLDGTERAASELAPSSPRRVAPLRLGAPTYTLNLPGRARLVERLAASGAGYVLEVRNGYGAQLISALFKGSLDAAVLPEPLDQPGLVTKSLGEMVLSHVMVPADHPCAGCAEISLGDLRGTRVATFRRELNPALYESLMKPLEDAGVILVPMHGVLDGIGQAAVALGLPFLLPLSDRKTPEGYVRRPLQSPMRIRTVLAVREEWPWPPRLEHLWAVVSQISHELSDAQPA